MVLIDAVRERLALADLLVDLAADLALDDVQLSIDAAEAVIGSLGDRSVPRFALI